MFWKKKVQINLTQKKERLYAYRMCYLYISEKYKHIMFVPFGKATEGFHVELDNIISDSWPCDFGKLQTNINETLNRYAASAVYIKGKWPSYDNSKAKSQQSLETDYIQIRLETDVSKGYGKGEVERIKISAQPSRLENTYSLVGCRHLLDTKVAQVVIDIFEACMKIRSL